MNALAGLSRECSGRSVGGISATLAYRHGTNAPQRARCRQIPVGLLLFLPSATTTPANACFGKLVFVLGAHCCALFFVKFAIFVLVVLLKQGLPEGLLFIRWTSLFAIVRRISRL